MQLSIKKEAELEQLIDSEGIAAVLGSLEEICHLKAEHLEAAWQDKTTSQLWLSLAAKIGKAYTTADLLT